MLLAHPWPGNVRELSNRITRALLVAQDGRITEAELDLPDPESTHAPSIRVFDRAELEAALGRHGGNVSKAAAELGLSRQALYRRMEKLEIPIERKVKP
jgi:transcriptional regulator of acetoin/glycerol metabolism